MKFTWILVFILLFTMCWNVTESDPLAAGNKIIGENGAIAATFSDFSSVGEVATTVSTFVKSSLSSIIPVLTKVIDVLVVVTDYLKRGFDAVSSWFSRLWGNIADFFQWLFPFSKGYGSDGGGYGGGGGFGGGGGGSW